MVKHHNRRILLFSLSRKTRKGQFFILGAFLLCALFYMGIPKSSQLTASPTYDLIYISNNLGKEIPNALNLGLNESQPIEHLENFTRFVRRVMLAHSTNFTVLWIVTENISTNDLNITVGNFLGSNKTLNITIGASSINITAPDNTTNSTSFGSDPGTEFNMTILFDSQNRTVEWQRDKLNIYALIQLKRGNNIQKREVTG